MKPTTIIGTIGTLILISTLLGCTAEQEIIIKDYIGKIQDDSAIRFEKDETLICNSGNCEPLRTQNNTILIASWNIQVFGKTKAAKPDVMAVIAQTIRQFDIVAIQEIRDKSGTAIQELERQVDALGTDYAVIIGPRLGRTSSKEQYAFIYRTDKIQPGHSYTYEDHADAFHREPMIAYFKVKEQRFDFTILNFHLDPDEVDTEFPQIKTCYYDAVNMFRNSNELDFLMVGDMNLDCSYFEESLLHATDWEYLIPNSMDTHLAVSSCTYDLIITTADTTETGPEPQASTALIPPLV